MNIFKTIKSRRVDFIVLCGFLVLVAMAMYVSFAGMGIGRNAIEMDGADFLWHARLLASWWFAPSLLVFALLCEAAAFLHFTEVRLRLLFHVVALAVPLALFHFLLYCVQFLRSYSYYIDH